MTYNEKIKQLEEKMGELFTDFPRILSNLSINDKKKLWIEYNNAMGMPSEFSEDDFDFELPDIVDWLHDEDYCCENENLFSSWKDEYEDTFNKSYECQVMIDMDRGNEEIV